MVAVVRQAHRGGNPVAQLDATQLARHARAEEKREHGKRQPEAQDHAPQRRHAFVSELRDDVAEAEDDGLHDHAKNERALPPLPFFRHAVSFSRSRRMRALAPAPQRGLSRSYVI